MRKRLVLAALLVTLPLVRPPPAAAHAFLEHAEPRVGSSIDASPPVLRLFFTEGIEPAFCRVEVTDAEGRKVETGPRRHPDANTLEVPLPELTPGEYTVHWAVVSVDTHPTDGSFTFSVKGPRR